MYDDIGAIVAPDELLPGLSVAAGKGVVDGADTAGVFAFFALNSFDALDFST
jgi:hypothetical protein